MKCECNNKLKLELKLIIELKHAKFEFNNKFEFKL